MDTCLDTFTERLTETLNVSGELASLELLYDVFDNYLLAGEVEKCDILLKNTPYNDLPVSVGLSALTVTLAYRDELKHRDVMYQAMYNRLVKERGTFKAINLLRGLR